jgi:ubiquinone/menaquinone biosynthesis C-methylase UbiE
MVVAPVTPAADLEVGAYFDRCAREGLMDGFDAQELASLERFLVDWDLRPGDRVLEPGCGSGRLTLRLAAAVGPAGLLLGLDLSRSMLERAARRGLPPQVRLARASVSAVPAANGAFSHAICLNVLPHFTGPERALAELHRVLAPGGHLWVNHFAGREAVNAFHRGLAPAVRDHQIPSLAALERLLAAAGFGLYLLADRPDGFRLHAVRG